MKSLRWILPVLLLACLSCAAQTHSYCPLDGSCTWTGVNTFSNTTNLAVATATSLTATNLTGPIGMNTRSPGQFTTLDTNNNVNIVGDVDVTPTLSGLRVKGPSTQALVLKSRSITQTVSGLGQSLLIQDLQGLQLDGGALFGVSAAKIFSAMQTITFSATPTFDVGLGNVVKITLTNDVTSSTLANASAGQELTFIVCQDGSGSHTFAWPTDMKGGMVIGSTASKCNTQQFIYDGTNAYALTSGQANL